MAPLPAAAAKLPEYVEATEGSLAGSQAVDPEDAAGHRLPVGLPDYSLAATCDRFGQYIRCESDVLGLGRPLLPQRRLVEPFAFR